MLRLGLTLALALQIIFAASFAAADPLIFTFGYLRMGSIDVDSPNTLAGFLATIQYANTYNTVPGVQFRLNVTTIPCMNTTDCNAISGSNLQLRQAFIANMPKFSAIIKPNYILARTLVNTAQSLGGIPVLDPDDIRMSSFGAAYSFIVNFNHNWQRQASHLFTYMHQTDRCVNTGIIHGTTSVDLASHLTAIRKLFTDGGYPSPPDIDVQGNNNTLFNSFFNSQARCYIVICNPFAFNSAMDRLYKMNFDFSSASFYMVSTAAGEDFVINGTSAPYANMKFIDWIPLVDSPILTQAFQEWVPNVADYATLLAPGEVLPTSVRRYTYQAYLTMTYLMENIRFAVSREASPNTTGYLPLRWSKIVDAFYGGSRVVEGYIFDSNVRSCPLPPYKQICFCNVVTPTSYLFGINASLNLAYTIYDDEALGQRNIASLEIDGSCGYTASSWSYPITGLALYPAVLMGTSIHRLTDLEEAYEVFQATFGGMTYDTNYAATAPTRALRYAAYDIQSNESLQDALDEYIDTIKPFVIYGTMVGTIENARGILTLGGSLITIDTEDPPLTTVDQWRWDVISLQPVLADYIHSLAAYYKARASTFTGLQAIATTQREAELISMSLATWGYNVPVDGIVVSSDPVVWSDFVSSWFGPGTDNTFILAASTANNNSVIEIASATASPLGRGVLAIACPIVYAVNAKNNATFNANGKGDIIFGAFRPAWWTAAAYSDVPSALYQYVSNPRYQIAMQILGVAQQLYVQAYYDYTITAATILYQTSVISSSSASFGPFSNDTCTDDQIATNARDRTCQCTKGARTIYVHSVRNYQSWQASDRTGRFSWTMSTCGVVYSPYVAPIETISAASLSSGSIAGIAVGCAAALLLIIGALAANSLLFGRNNSAAPKDSSQPFAIVFTDIQSSTALWARAPGAMSEAVDQHHELLRKVLRRNDGYEVKTVGDSFMVAFKDAADAAMFALDAQLTLYAADWSTELDAIYLELIAEAETDATAFEEVAGSSNSKYYGQYASDNDPKNLLKLPEAASSTTHSHSFYSGPSGPSDYQPQSARNNIISPRVSQAFNKSVSYGNSYGPQTERLSVSLAMNNNNRTRDSSEAFTRPIAQTPRAAAVPIKDKNESRTDYSYSFDQATDKESWHGLRVRIGVHFGMGDIRKDPVSLGYDYYGTVVNTAARVEGVGHGGQILITDAAFDCLPPSFAKNSKAIIVAMGPQPLRGLDAPINIFQMIPAKLQGRRFPPLRLHIEKDTEESSITETTTATGTTGTETPEVMVSRICSNKQYNGIAPEEILDRYHYFTSTFGPTPDKYKASVIAKLAECWGFEKAAKVVHSGEIGRARLLVSLIAKVTKTFHAGQKAALRNLRQRMATHSISNTHLESISEAVKSIHMADMASCSDGR